MFLLKKDHLARVIATKVTVIVNIALDTLHLRSSQLQRHGGAALCVMLLRLESKVIKFYALCYCDSRVNLYKVLCLKSNVTKCYPPLCNDGCNSEQCVEVPKSLYL